MRAKVKEVCEGLKYNTTQEYLDLIQRTKQGDGSVKCFIYDLEAHQRKNPGAYDASTDANIVKLMPAFVEEKAIPDGDGEDSNEAIGVKYKNMVGWDGEAIKFVGVAIESRNLTFYNRPPEWETQKNYEAYDKLRSNVDAIAKDACGSPVQMTDLDGKFVFMNNQRIYRTSAIRGALIGILIAFVVLLLCTWSLVISLFSTLSILCTMMSVVGITTMMGWTLGTVQAILISILAGFSVDYVVHLAHAYSHSPGTREERVTEAFSEMGSPVMSGMITSVLASLPLFVCNLIFFAQFGTFLCFTILFSWLFANFGFMSLMATFGPEGPPTTASNKVQDEPAEAEMSALPT